MKVITKSLLAVVVLATAPVSAGYAQDMSNADKQALIENFLQADSNNDGILYLSEFESLMKLNANDKIGKAAMVVRMGAYEKAFGRLDTNTDGAVTREEIQALAEENS